MWPNERWSRLHIDYVGPIHNQMMLLIVDSHSKWIDVHVTTSSNASVTIEKLMSSFATYGLPHTIVLAKGPYFLSFDFELFNKMNGIRYIKVSPHRPASNGLAERAVQTVKSGITKMEGGNLQLKVTRFLSRYRITPQAITGISPSQLLMKRGIRSRLDLLNLILSKKVLDAQNKQKMHHDYHARDRTFDIGDPVVCHNYERGDELLLPSHIIVMSGPVSFQIKLNDGRIMKRHLDQIRHRHCTEKTPNKLPEITIPPNSPMNIPKITQNLTITTPMATEDTLESTDAVPVAPTSNVTITTQFSPNHDKTSQSDSIANTRPKRNIREPNFCAPNYWSCVKSLLQYGCIYQILGIF